MGMQRVVNATAVQRWPASLHWWIDAVGGFLVLTKKQIRIGNAGDERNDVAILANLSALHAELRQGESGTVLIAHAKTKINDVASDAALLRDGDRIRLRDVELTYHQPTPWSLTARFELTSHHRLPLALDGIVLLGETCVLGSGRDAHIRTQWGKSVFLNWYRDTYWVRGPGNIKIDGRTYENCGPLTPTSQVEGPWGSFRWEPVEP